MPVEAATSVTSSSGAPAAPGERASAISSLSWPTVAGIGGERADELRMIEAAAQHRADRRLTSREQTLLLDGKIRLRGV